MKTFLVRNIRNSKCSTMRLSGLDWSNVYVDGSLRVKAEDGNTYHTVRPKDSIYAKNRGYAPLVGLRSGQLVWVCEQN